MQVHGLGVEVSGDPLVTNVQGKIQKGGVRVTRSKFPVESIKPLDVMDEVVPKNLVDVRVGMMVPYAKDIVNVATIVEKSTTLMRKNGFFMSAIC